MNKTIEKIEEYKSKEIAKAIEKAKKGYEDAKDFFTDTGYDWYFNKMQKCEAELQELEDYLHKDETAVKDLSTDQYREYLKMKEDLKNLKSKLIYLISDLGLPETANLISMQDILREYE